MTTKRSKSKKKNSDSPTITPPPDTNPPASVADAEEQLEGDEQSDGFESARLGPLAIRKEIHSIDYIMGRIKRCLVDLAPDFQRTFVWSEERQGKLIESCLLDIPLQSIYLAATPEGIWVAVDGLQRLTTFSRFYDGQLVLDLPHYPEIHGKTFSTLPERLRSAFEQFQLTCIIIQPDVPFDVAFTIFERVNSGVALNRQQMRGALFSGDASRLLVSLAANGDFRAMAGNAIIGPEGIRRMKDREAANRFLAHFLLGYGAYKNYDTFLSEALLAVKKAPSVTSKVEDAFARSMKINREIFGDGAFRKSVFSTPGGGRGSFNLALWDALSTGFAKHDIKPSDYEAVAKATRKLGPKIMESITSATAKQAHVITRCQLVDDMLAKLAGPVKR